MEQDIEVQGTLLVTDVYVRNFVTQNCIKITRDVRKFEPLTDGFIHYQLIQKTMNTRIHYMSVNITLSTQETNTILKKGTRGSFQLWGKDDHDLAVTILQKSHDLSGFGLTPNVITQTSVKVPMASRFLGLVGSLPLEEQQFWLPNQQAHDPDSWTTPYLLQLKMEYDVLIHKYGCKVKEMYTLQNHPPPPSEFLLLPSLDSLYKAYVRNQELPQPGDSLPTQECSSNWPFTRNKP
jgi:hypothetical protein